MDDFSPTQLAEIEAETLRVGRHVFEHLRVREPSVFERRWWEDRIMAWAMEDEQVRVQMFRFVDVLPTLDDSQAVVGHLKEYLGEVEERLPKALKLGVSVASARTVAGRALAIAARRNVMGQARRFIAGSNAEEVLKAARQERKLQRGFTLDILGEAVTSDTEADAYFRQYAELIEGIAAVVNTWPEVPLVDRGPDGFLPRANISIKLSALDSQADAIDPARAIDRVGGRLADLLRLAAEHRAFVNVDMESYHIKDLTLAIFQHVLSQPEFRDTTDVGIVIQAYLKDSADDLCELRDWAQRRGAPVWVRLVKGAYWDYETVHAASENWEVPVFQRKWKTDANFERLTRFLVRHHELLRPALGSHNIRSLAHGIATVRQLELPPSELELQMLYGMGDAEKQTFTDLGYRMRIYMPYGELIPGMAYLVRRLLENTSNDSFLRASFAEHVAPERLLMNPADVEKQQGEGAANSAASNAAARRADNNGSSFAPIYRNEPLADFALKENRTAMADALAEVKEQLGETYCLVIGGAEVHAAQQIVSLNPSHTSQVVGRVASASSEQAEQAVSAAAAAWPRWAATPVEKRADYLRRAAEVMRMRRFELAAWIVYECGKPWREADGDVCEAIDFCEYYALSAERMHAAAGVDVAGEENRFEYRPRGVAAVIAPWNFPLAILTGMTAAALVTGNTVVMKPAEQSPVIARHLMDIFAGVGLPPGVLNYLPGEGESAGAALVADPRTALVAFTGSRQVGLAINAAAASKSAEAAAVGKSVVVTKVIAEMGGKNAIIVDADADLDEAVLGVAKSAFGYQGQKCSACSRCIVLAPVYKAFLARLTEAARSLVVAPAEDPACRVGPLIDEAAVARVREYLEVGRREGREVMAVDVGNLADEGYYVGPHIFAEVPPKSRLGQEEIFGPVLAVMRAESLAEAIALANDTDYALTGGIYSRSPNNLDRACAELNVGNLYLNRPCTGALVGRQPFGGYKLSGIGSKAGGSDYLLQFVVPRTITENTLRRGFAPPPVE